MTRQSVPDVAPTVIAKALSLPAIDAAVVPQEFAPMLETAGEVVVAM